MPGKFDRDTAPSCRNHSPSNRFTGPELHAWRRVRLKGISTVTTERTALSLFTLWSLLEQTYSLLYRNLDRHMAKSEVSQSQASVLLGLKAAGQALPLSRVGSLRVLQASTVTALVDRLEAGGLVRRVRTSPDRRVINLELTPQGEALCEELYPRELLGLTENFASLGPRESEALVKSLRTLRDGGADVLHLSRTLFEEIAL